MYFSLPVNFGIWLCKNKTANSNINPIMKQTKGISKKEYKHLKPEEQYGLSYGNELYKKRSPQLTNAKTLEKRRLQQKCLIRKATKND